MNKLGGANDTCIQPCKICGEMAHAVGERKGRIEPFAMFTLLHCSKCHFSFVGNPRTDFASLYSDDYYAGKGADPLVNYRYDFDYPETTLKNYEWQAIVEIYHQLTSSDHVKWLDFGCGLGSLVQFVRALNIDIYGYDSSNKFKGEFILNDLEGDHSFDFVTAIEVIEHTLFPLDVLRQMRELLKPGGILFFTTGNAEPWRTKLTRWPYTSCPDVHVSFFEPKTLAIALEKSGFEACFPGYLRGYTPLIKNKVLKNLGFVNKNFLFDLLPWSLMSRVVDARYKLSAMPIGIAR